MNMIQNNLISTLSTVSNILENYVVWKKNNRINAKTNQIGIIDDEITIISANFLYPIIKYDWQNTQTNKLKIDIYNYPTAKESGNIKLVQIVELHIPIKQQTTINEIWSDEYETVQQIYMPSIYTPTNSISTTYIVFSIRNFDGQNFINYAYRYDQNDQNN